MSIKGKVWSVVGITDLVSDFVLKKCFAILFIPGLAGFFPSSAKCAKWAVAQPDSTVALPEPYCLWNIS